MYLRKSSSKRNGKEYTTAQIVEGYRTEDDIRKQGYSRDHRSDRRQVVIGVVMNQDGIPLAHYTFEGNISDRSTS